MEKSKNKLELRYEVYQAVIRGLTLMSDTFMRNVLKQRECAEYILQVIMKDKKLRITEAIVQKDYKNLQGRSAVLDCVARMKTAESLRWRFSRKERERRQREPDITADCWT